MHMSFEHYRPPTPPVDAFVYLCEKAPELGPEKIKLAAVLQVNLAAIFNRLEVANF